MPQHDTAIASTTPRNTQPLPDDWLGKLHALPYDAYAALSGINATGLKNILRSPAYYKYQCLHPKAPTKEMLTGTYVHTAVLEPAAWSAHARVLPAFEAIKGVTIKAQKLDWLAQQPDNLMLVTQDVYELVSRMAEAVHNNPEAMALLGKGIEERSIWWRDPDYDTVCKARIDFIAEVGGSIALDLKTTMDASPTAFCKEIVNRRYDLQAQHYLEAGRVTGAYRADVFFFIVVDKEPPHQCVVYEVTDKVLGMGRLWRDEAMQIYKECRTQGNWPGLPSIDKIGLPRWAKAPGQEIEDDDDV